jgi:hypothetical protein
VSPGISGCHLPADRLPVKHGRAHELLGAADGATVQAARSLDNATL